MIKFEPWRNDTEGGNRSTRSKACPIAILSAINLTWTGRRSNPVLSGRLKYMKCIRDQLVLPENSVCLHYREQSENIVKRNNRFLRSIRTRKHLYNVWKKYRFIVVVIVMSTGVLKVSPSTSFSFILQKTYDEE